MGYWIWDSTQKNSGNRGLFTYIFHVVMAYTGWFLGKWLGLLLFFVPVVIFYYYLLAHLSMVIVPASDPGNWKERFLRVRYFFWYTWGFQFPAWAVAKSTGRIAEVKIKGDQFTRITAPGLVWAYSHQVVGLTTGINFSRIVAPGTVFTRPFERPFEGITDLRTQLRTFWIDVVSSDGIPYKALLFTSFAVDREKWDRKILHRLYLENRLLKDARVPDYTEGSFPFSRLRIRTLLSSTGIYSSIQDPAEPESTFWDQMVMYHVEKAACEVLSQKRFDELWLPADDFGGACASDEIANAIREQCFFNLLCRGVRFFSCRLVNFQFTREKLPEPGEVERQQIAAWQADWQRDALETRAAGNAEADLVQQQARALAYASLLTAVAEGLQEARGLDPSLPRYMIAMRFVGALEQILQRQPEGDGKSEASRVIATWKRRLPSDSASE